MIRLVLALSAMAALLAACAPAPLTEPAAPKAAPYHAGPLLVGQWGVGPIRSTTYFEKPRIQDLFPIAQARDATIRVAPDETTAAILVDQGGAPLLEIDDGTANAPGTNDPMIGSVRVLGGPAAGPHGERLGMTWIQSGFDLSECEIGSDRDRNTVFCARPGEGAVTYQFAVPTWDSEEVPPSSLMRKVAYIKAIIWTPPGTAGP